MNALQLAKEIDRRGLLGSPVRLCGGREYGAACTGWYYSLSGSLCSITDAVLDHGCGYRRRGEAADNVDGPFASRTEAIADLACWIEEPEGREWAEAAIADDDELQRRRQMSAETADERARAKRRAKRARYAANRRARGLPVHHEAMGGDTASRGE